VPTSVLLAVLAAAGLLALAPALVRRYDATERLVAERALSTARVLARAGARRHRRRRTVPGRRPLNPPRAALAGAAWARAPLAGASPAHAPVAGDPRPGAAPSGAGRGGALPSAQPAAAGTPRLGDAAAPAAQPRSGAGAESAGSSAVARRGRSRRGSGSPARPARRAPRRLRHPPAVYRRRRVFAALVLLNTVELVGVVCVGPGFWISAAVSGLLLVSYVVHLRNRALLDQRRRRAEARYAAWVAARQAAIRREQVRRMAARREALYLQLLERERLRREAARVRAQSALRGRAYQTRSWRAANE
jgi:hypothetical protein